MARIGIYVWVLLTGHLTVGALLASYEAVPLRDRQDHGSDRDGDDGDVRLRYLFGQPWLLRVMVIWALCRTWRSSAIRRYTGLLFKLLHTTHMQWS
jgi:hypothetical protein